MKYVNPIGVGSLTIRPNWRFEVLQNPAKYKLADFVSIPENNVGCLKRFISAGLTCEINYKIPEYLKEYINGFTSEEIEVFNNLWYKQFKRSGQKKISVRTKKAIFQPNPVWNLKYVHLIQDEFLRKLILHHSNFKYDDDIQYAFQVYKSADHEDIFKFIGYGIYAGISDSQLAKRWNIKPSQVTAIRKIFFDFSRFPKDRVARFAYLRQLANIGLFSDTDFSFFKRIFELGELGLRAQVDFTSLTYEEKLKIQEYLSQSIVANTLNINFSIRNQKDAVTYGVMVTTLSNYYIKQKESQYFDAKIHNLNVVTSRIEGQMTPNTEGLTDLDEQFIALIKENSLLEPMSIEYKTLEMLKN